MKGNRREIIANSIENRRMSDNLYDPRTRGREFRLQSLPPQAHSFELPRSNYFSIVSVEAGRGRFWADAAEHPFCLDQLLFFVPYQYIRFDPQEPVWGSLLHFHANFLCVETFHAETGCSGRLFNDPYGLPLVKMDGRTKSDLGDLLARMYREQDEQQLASREVLLACMKIILILATRLKSSQTSGCGVGTGDFRHPVLGPLRELIEQNYRSLHAPSDYADLLHLTPKTLGRCVREQLGKTLTDLIRERILTHAKWDLLHSLKPVKEIAVELGFHDELYFSRLFKKATGISPTFFREFETEIRGGSNLSISSSHAPILILATATDNSSVSSGEPGSAKPI